MNQDENQKPGAPQFDNITVETAPLAFRHTDIATAYSEGAYTSRLDAEVDDLLRDAELPGPAEAGVMPLTTEALDHLCCIAIIHNGQIIPVVDLPRTPRPTTPAQKMGLCAMAAREVLDALIDVLDHLDRRIDQQNDQCSEEQDDDDKEGGCHAPVA
jgi:hypothetical protein